VEQPTTPEVVSATVSTEVTLEVTEQLATAGDDTLITTGSAIDGLDGEDTIVLRGDESITGADLGTLFSNIETLDLTTADQNSLGPISAEQVEAMTDDDNILTIEGTADDVVNLTSDWVEDAGMPGTYTTVTAADSTPVTLVIDTDITVNVAPAFAFSVASFGLASLSSFAPAAAEEDDTDADLGLSFADVMSEDDEEDLTTLLPESASESDASDASDTGTVSKDADVDVVTLVDTTWEDDSLDGVVYDS
jgi:hypothetical protein